jgi:hypothetical protein
MRPIVRWTVSRASKEGLQCLQMSIRLMTRFYGDRFNYAVCHNDIAQDQLRPLLEDFDLQYISQAEHVESLPFRPWGPAWKLYPPRLDINTHEIFIDNDLILWKRPEFLEEFLTANDFFITESPYRCFGTYDRPDIQKCYNSGLFGIPPGYDFASALRTLMTGRTGYETRYDEQGMVSSLLHDQGCRQISSACVFECFDKFRLGMHGCHFVGLNYAKPDYWYRFLGQLLL